MTEACIEGALQCTHIGKKYSVGIAIYRSLRGTLRDKQTSADRTAYLPTYLITNKEFEK